MQKGRINTSLRQNTIRSTEYQLHIPLLANQRLIFFDYFSESSYIELYGAEQEYCTPRLLHGFEGAEPITMRTLALTQQVHGKAVFFSENMTLVVIANHRDRVYDPQSLFFILREGKTDVCTFEIKKEFFL